MFDLENIIETKNFVLDDTASEMKSKNGQKHRVNNAKETKAVLN